MNPPQDQQDSTTFTTLKSSLAAHFLGLTLKAGFIQLLLERNLVFIRKCAYSQHRIS